MVFKLKRAGRVSTHSHPKVAAQLTKQIDFESIVSTHSHPKVAASNPTYVKATVCVSTHSHPKVAARIRTLSGWIGSSFNTQPPEGGCKALNFI